MLPRLQDEIFACLSERASEQSKRMFHSACRRLDLELGCRLVQDLHDTLGDDMDAKEGVVVSVAASGLTQLAQIIVELGFPLHLSIVPLLVACRHGRVDIVRMIFEDMTSRISHIDFSFICKESVFNQTFVFINPTSSNPAMERTLPVVKKPIWDQKHRNYVIWFT